MAVPALVGALLSMPIPAEAVVVVRSVVGAPADRSEIFRSTADLMSRRHVPEQSPFPGFSRGLPGL